MSSLQEIKRRWKCFSGPVRIKAYGPKEELPKELRDIVEAAGAAEVIDGGTAVGSLWAAV